MSFHAWSHFSVETDSKKAGSAAAKALKEGFGSRPLKAALLYASVTHDQGALLRAARAELGPDVPIVGCSVQGVIGNGVVREGGYLLGAMGLGGDQLKVSVSIERDIPVDTRTRGRRLGAQTRARLAEDPKVCVVLYDPLCNADVEQMLAGLTEELSCPLIGGGAGQPFGPIVKTFQYWQDEVVEHSAIAVGLAGPLTTELGVCHGTSPTGFVMTVTRCEGNALLEIDGRRALDVWLEVTGASVEEVNNQEFSSNWAIGIERTVLAPDGEKHSMYFVRAAFGFDLDRGAVVVQAAIPQGTRVMLHHRTVPAVTEGTVSMGRDLAARLAGRVPWAVLGFECGARTSPFLGEAGTLKENLALQKTVAGDAPWLGMMAWGEIAPVAGKPAFHNYTYPLLVLAA
ncbi:MAG TPA: FIST N-terminal domain-containing protein [Polyangiaceae bacterium]|nr:FIST N-terminal domain-containing protein [Polyangiaceae bacterium]